MKKYKAVVGINYKDKNGGTQEIRVEAGEYVENMNEVSLKNEIHAGNIIVEEQVIQDGQEVTNSGTSTRK